MVRVGIMGATGYTGLELVKLLLRHPEAKIVGLSSRQEGQPSIGEVHPALNGRLDLKFENITPAELAAPLKGTFRLPLEGQAGGRAGGEDEHEPTVTVDAFVGWFDVTFAGSAASPAPHTVVLTTAPDEAGATHWGQQVFPLSPAVRGGAGDALTGTITIARRPDNHRLMAVDFEWTLEGGSTLARAGAGTQRKASFQVE